MNVFIGLGKMGLPIAKHFERKHNFHVWDTNFPRCKNFNNIMSWTDLAPESIKTVVSCLPNSTIVEKEFNYMLDLLQPNSYWIDLTSGDPLISRKLYQYGKRYQNKIHFIDCGISGGSGKAMEGKLTSIVGGDKTAVKKIFPYFYTFSQKVFYVGPSGSGHAVKAINNALMAINLWAAAEGISTLEKFGIRADSAIAAINSSSGRSIATQQRFPNNILTNKYDYGYSLELLRKDVQNALAVCENVGSVNPMMRRQLTLLTDARRILENDADHTEIYKLFQ